MTNKKGYDKMTIGQAIRKARKERGYSQQKLSMRSGVCILSISKYERDISIPTAISLICLADALGITLDKLVGRDNINLH